MDEVSHLKPRVCGDGFVTQGPTVVGNIFLSNLSYKHTIEPMVSSLFPDAVYHRVDDRAIKDIPTIDKGGTLVIQGQKGFGKSKAIRMLKESCFKGKSIVHINFSRSLAYFSAIKRGKDVHHYSKDEEPLTQDLLEVVINSLARVKRPYDVVIIDEVVSVMSSISGSLITDTHRMSVLNALRRLLVAAKYVIIADAFVEPVTVHFVRVLRGSWSPLRFIDYTFRPQNGHECVVYRYKDEWKTALMRAIGNGLKVVVPCMYRYMVKALASEISRAWPDLAIQAYFDGPGSDDTAGAMKNIKRWKRCRVLLYSPCITAGCSFEEKHFDTQFFYGVSSPYTGNVQSALQMTSRVRDIKNRDIHVYIDDDYFGPDHPPDLHLPLCDPNNPMDVLDAANRSIRLFAQRSFRSKVSGFANDFFQHKLDAGFWIRYPCGTDVDYLRSFGLIEPSPPVKITEEPSEDLLSHMTMSDLEKRFTQGPIFPLVDSLVEDDAVLDFEEIGAEVRDKETLEYWGFLMTLYFMRPYREMDPVHDFPFLTMKFDHFELESTLRAKVKVYMERGKEKYNMRKKKFADLVWGLSLVNTAYRRGRKPSLAMAKASFPGHASKALTVIRHAGMLLLSLWRSKEEKGWHLHVLPNLPHLCAKEEEGQVHGHFLVDFVKSSRDSDRRDDDTPDESKDEVKDTIKESHLYLLVWEEPKGNQLKNDFLRLFCQASYLAAGSPYTPTHLEVLHMGKSKSWNVPFSVTSEDWSSIIQLFQTKEAQEIRSRVGVLEVDFSFGVLTATYWPPRESLEDPLEMYEFHRTKEFRTLVQELAASDLFIVGFDIWKDLEELYEGEPEMEEMVHRFYDLQLMVSVMVDPELDELIRDHKRLMGLGYYLSDTNPLTRTPIDGFIDAFIDIKQSKGITYLLPNERLVSAKCGDVMSIGDCLNLV